MNKIQQTIKNNEEEFYKKFINLLQLSITKDGEVYEDKKDEVEAFIKQSNIELLTAVEEEINKKAKENHNTSNPWDYEQIITVSQVKKIISDAKKL